MKKSNGLFLDKIRHSACPHIVALFKTGKVYALGHIIKSHTGEITVGSGLVTKLSERTCDV
jgi:hypothetical protein